jgi:hypothetical protein
MQDNLFERARRISIGDVIWQRGIILKRVGTEFCGPCPRCGGTDRFSFNPRKNLWNCRGCKPKDIAGDVIGFVQWLDGVDAIHAAKHLVGDVPTNPKANGHDNPSTAQDIWQTPIEAIYPYEDDGGQLRYEVIRFAGKQFRQRRPDGNGGWIRSIEGVTPLPFRLPEMLEDLAQDRAIFTVEGEKDVNTARALGLPATCNSGGAGKFSPDIVHWFHGADVIIAADNDPPTVHPRTGQPLLHNNGRERKPGIDHAHDVARKLAGTAARTRILDLGKWWPECPSKGDISDFFAAGKTVEDLWEIVDKLPDWTPASANEQTSATGTNEYKTKNFNWTVVEHGETSPQADQKELVATLLPEIGAALISGQWGTYKTFMGMYLAACVMTGKPFFGFPIRRPGGVLWIGVEGQAEINKRITAAWEAEGGTGKAPFNWITAAPRLLDRDAREILGAMAQSSAGIIQRKFNLPLVLVIIDTIGKAAGATKEGQLNDDASVKLIMSALGGASIDASALFVGVAHFGKRPETGTKGSTSFEDDADAVLAMIGEKDISGKIADVRMCSRKYRSGENGREFQFRTKVVDIGADQYGQPVTTLVIDPGEATQTATKTKDKPDPWRAKSVRLLRKVLMNLLVDCGVEQRPHADGPTVRAVDMKLVRGEFEKSYPVTEDDPVQARRKAFKRAIDAAAEKDLIGTRVMDSITWIWLAVPPQADP